MDEPHKKTRRSKRVAAIIGAWVVIPIAGIFSLLWALLISSVIINGDSEETLAARWAILVGVSGLGAIYIAIVTMWSQKRRSFFKHLSIGLWIGVVLYGLILVGGVIGYAGVVNNSADSSSGVCTTLGDQYHKALGAVVSIETNTGTGSGVAVGDGLTIVTAYHVIDGATNIRVNFIEDQRVLTILAVAPEFDLALLRADRPMSDSMQLTAKYTVGDSLYALGYPHNALTAGQPSLSSGILSRVLSSDDLKLNSADSPSGLEMIQTDMALNPGNSGGPVFNKCGLIGVVSAKSNTQDLASVSSEEGINYSISAKTIAQRFSLPIKNLE